MLPSDLTLSALRFILSAKSRQSCKQDCETVDFYNSLNRIKPPSYPSDKHFLATDNRLKQKVATYILRDDLLFCYDCTALEKALRAYD